MTKIEVTKRDGRREPFDEDKINKVVGWATEGIKGVSPSDVVIAAKVSMEPGIATEAIHQALIRAAVNCFTLDAPNYQYVASRLLSFDLRKRVWGGVTPPRFYDFLQGVVSRGYYDPKILEDYSKEEIEALEAMIDHDRDDAFTYAGLRQMLDKYLVQNRATKEIVETPQFAFMAIAMTVFSGYKKKDRLDFAKRAYDVFSKFKANLPTPQIAGIRTPLRSYSSCALFDVGDSIDSIFATNHAVGKAVASRYGIGINLGRLRAVGAPIRNGEVVHTGVVPFLKIFESTVKSCQQGGIRGGGATINFPFWHYEIEDIMVLKNNGGTEENRVRKLDYVIQLSKLFYERFLKDEDVTLFSPHEVPDLYEAFGTEGFDALYERRERDPNVKMKRKVSARRLMALLVKERIETGRIYVMNIDHVQNHSAWDVRTYLCNLCLEICQPTEPLKDISDPDGEIGICTLSAINVCEIKDDEDLKNTCDVVVRMLEQILDHQTYFCPAAESFSKKRRSLGIGMNGLAGWLAKNGLRYSDDAAPGAVSRLQERISYYLYKTSVQLAKEKGPCEKFHETKLSKGILPIDTYKKDVDAVVPPTLQMDWEGLREEIKRYGMRHSTLTAQMPCESCLRGNTVVHTKDHGSIPFYDLLTVAGLNREAIEGENRIGWHDLPNPVVVQTRHGDREVSKAFYNGVSETFDIAMEDGSVIQATAKHKFLVRSETGDIWKRTADLAEGDDIAGVASDAKVLSVKKSADTAPTWDLEVPDVHEYVVGNGLVCHNSSVTSNSTNGIEPARAPITYKKSKMGSIPVMVPDWEKRRKFYEWAYDIGDNEKILNVVAGIAKWLDMAVSTNVYYRYQDYESGKLPDMVVIKDLIYAYKMGIPTLYYANTDATAIFEPGHGASTEPGHEIQTRTAPAAQQTQVSSAAFRAAADIENPSDEGCESGACTI